MLERKTATKVVSWVKTIKIPKAMPKVAITAANSSNHNNKNHRNLRCSSNHKDNHNSSSSNSNSYHHKDHLNLYKRRMMNNFNPSKIKTKV